MNKKQQQANIEAHGNKLQSLYPDTISAGWTPVELCKRLHRIERKAHNYTLQLCNGPEISGEDQDKFQAHILKRLSKLLGKGPSVFINRDPRGYALKIETENAVGLDIYKDWGGFGIICPEF